MAYYLNNFEYDGVLFFDVGQTEQPFNLLALPNIPLEPCQVAGPVPPVHQVPPDPWAKQGTELPEGWRLFLSSQHLGMQ